MKLFFKTVFVVYLLILLWLVLFKFSRDLSWVADVQTRSLALIPFADISPDTWMEMLLNFVAFIPFGLLLSVNFKRMTFRRKLVFVGVFSLAVEIIQFVFAMGATDMTDVVTNTLGGFAGLMLYRLGSRFAASKKLDKSIAVTCTLLFMVLLGILFFGGIRLQFGTHDRPEYDTLQATSVLKPLASSAQLEWPAVGQAAIGSVEDGVLARSSDREERRPTASMAKVITALAIMEKRSFALGQEGRSYVLTADDVANYEAYVAMSGSVVPVREGMVLTQYQAMQAMLIASANNIADTLVEREFGSMEAYTSYAQDMVERMGLHQTVVADASGFSPATVSTPSDLVAIGIAALKDPVIAEIVAQSQAYIPGVGTIENTNELLRTDGAVGIKTGTTDEAGSCLLFAIRYKTEDEQKVTIVGVVMGDTTADDLFSDSRKLFMSVGREFGLVETQPTGTSPELKRMTR